MKKYSIFPISLAVVFSGAVALWMAIQAPARAVERDLAAINALTAGETSEAELLSRKEFKNLDRMCLEATCFYHLQVDNNLLSRLHLAPPIFMWAMVNVREGLVTSVSVSTSKASLPGVTLTQVQTLPKECLAVPCVRPVMLPNKTLMSVNILFDHQSDLRNQLPKVINAQCWSRLHGCATYAEVMPLLQKLNLGLNVDKPPTGMKLL
ncbi:MAG TPA: hypothetical protein VJW20_01095 [Candidatus Angelobacter sp.]|nr:hypothetical protein [Candidatus Angelobacter sp.]